MASFFSHYSPVRGFPGYSGPYAVGSCDVEVPVSELDSPADAPDPTTGTVSFRLFYPCQPEERARPVKWVPSPQSRYVSAYCRFIGAGPAVADFLSFFPQFLYMTRIPVHRNGKLLNPTTESGRWPVLVFSHGLGGSRNAYSQICGSLASYGIIVIAPDHRDSSAPVSFVRATNTTASKMIAYRRFAHTPTPEIYEARDTQLRTRLWELGCIHDAIVRMDLGTCPDNLDPNNATRGKKTEVLQMFRSRMAVHEPGSIAWGGHSFGAATTVQFIKSTYYGAPSAEEAGEFGETIYNPRRDSNLVKQITPRSVALLLDMWCLPLRSRTTRWLWDKAMPCYDTTTAAPAGGKAIVAVESEAFTKWDGNMNDTKRAISPRTPAPSKFIQWTPAFFYAADSAHLSQSDFGILFPLVTARMLKTKEPERIVRLNVRAMLQCLRENGFDIAAPTPADLADDSPESAPQLLPSGRPRIIKARRSADTLVEDEKPAVLNDARILAFGAQVRSWHWIPVAAFRETADDESDMHVEQDYQTQAVEMDEAAVLDFQTPGMEMSEHEVMRPRLKIRSMSQMSQMSRLSNLSSGSREITAH